MYITGEFTIDDYEWSVEGLTDGRLWNGWDCPVFQRCDAVEVMNHCYGEINVDWYFNDKRDAFIGWLEGGDLEPDVWPGSDIQDADGNTLHVYGVGSGSWIWDIVRE